MARNLPPNLHSHEHGSITPMHPFMTAGAQTLLPFIRAPLGRHLVNPFPALIMAGVVGFVLPFVGEFGYLVFTGRNELPGDPGRDWLTGFAAAYFALTCVHWIARLIGQWRGQEVATSECGYSWLVRWTRLPVGLCEVVLVPLIVAALSLLVWPFSVELSLWLAGGAFSLFAVGQWEQRRNLSQSTVIVDDLVRGRAWEGRFDRQEERRNRREKSRTGKAEPECQCRRAREA